MYTKQVFERAREELEKRRRAAEAAAAERTLDARIKCSGLAELDEELATTGPQIFRAAVAGRDIEPIRRRNLELNERRRELLTAAGLGADYTDTKYTCSACSDTGYDGEGRMCSCLRELIRLEGIRESGIGALIERQSFDNFDLGWYGEAGEARVQMENNYRVLKAYAEGFSEKTGGTLLFLGKTGTGKTHLSTAVARCVIEAGCSVLYDSVQNILADFETDKFKSGYGYSEPKADKYLECDLLIIDDLGTEFSSQFTLSVLYNLINTRQNKGLATIVSTNLSVGELSQKYEDRIFSRLIGSGSRIFQFVGRDHRIG